MNDRNYFTALLLRRFISLVRTASQALGEGSIPFTRFFQNSLFSWVTRRIMALLA